MAKVKFNDYEEALKYVNSLPINTIVQDYAKLLMETQTKNEPIKITEAQLKYYFKIVGVTATGEAERRGRPKKD